MAALPVFIILICQHSPGLKPGLFFHLIVIASYKIKSPTGRMCRTHLSECLAIVTVDSARVWLELASYFDIGNCPTLFEIIS